MADWHKWTGEWLGRCVRSTCRPNHRPRLLALSAPGDSKVCAWDDLSGKKAKGQWVREMGRHSNAGFEMHRGYGDRRSMFD